MALKGEVALRDASAVNEQMATGKVEVLVKEAKLLNAAETPPIYVEDGAKNNEAIGVSQMYTTKESAQRAINSVTALLVSGAAELL